jgi:hypothetical protein
MLRGYIVLLRISCVERVFYLCGTRVCFGCCILLLLAVQTVYARVPVLQRYRGDLVFMFARTCLRHHLKWSLECGPFHLRCLWAQ